MDKMNRFPCQYCGCLVSEDRVICTGCGAPARSYREAIANQQEEGPEELEEDEADLTYMYSATARGKRGGQTNERITRQDQSAVG
jgi:hypothetical protein